MEQCEWPKGCAGGVFAYVRENDEEYGHCGMHLLEWLSNLPYRDEVEDAALIVNDKRARSHWFEWTAPQEEAIEELVNRPACPDCGAQYTPPMNPDHAQHCAGREQ